MFYRIPSKCLVGRHEPRDAQEIDVLVNSTDPQNAKERIQITPVASGCDENLHGVLELFIHRPGRARLEKRVEKDLFFPRRSPRRCGLKLITCDFVYVTDLKCRVHLSVFRADKQDGTVAN